MHQGNQLETNSPPVALTIAGSDSGGGGRIQADLKSFAANGVFGTCAITAITAQNTVGVSDIHQVPSASISAQIISVLSDFTVASVKTGMLGSVKVVDLVAEFAASGYLPNLVVDPVMVATSGDRLASETSATAYMKALFPCATIITPNLYEASLLVGRTLRTVDDVSEAARELASTGTASVLIKGGHLDSAQAVDIFFDGAELHEIKGQWLTTSNTHGTGCTLASAIAAQLALGNSTLDAVRNAKAYLTRALTSAASWQLGAGHGPVDHFPKTPSTIDKFQ